MADIRKTAMVDDFERADEDPILPPWQRDWAGRVDMKLNTGSIGSTSPHPGNGGWAYWSTKSFTGPEIEIWAVAHGNANIQDSYQMMLMTSGTPSGYEIHSPNPVGSDSWQLWRYDSGSTTQIGSVVRPVIAAPSLIMLRLTATDVEAWENADGTGNTWTLELSAADTTYRSNLYLTLGGRGAPGWASVGGGIKRRLPQIYRRPNE